MRVVLLCPICGRYQSRGSKCGHGYGIENVPTVAVPKESAPPQPGDAESERLAELRRWRDDHTNGTGTFVFLMDQLDAAQSALAESQQTARMRRNDWLVTSEKLAESQANIRLLEKAHAQNNQALSDARAALAESRKDAASLKAQHARLGEECDRYIRWNQDKQRELAESRRERDEARAAIKRLKQGLATDPGLLSSLPPEQQVAAEAAALRAEVARLKDEYMLRDVQATGAALELDEARAELARLRSPTSTGED